MTRAIAPRRLALLITAAALAAGIVTCAATATPDPHRPPRNEDIVPVDTGPALDWATDAGQLRPPPTAQVTQITEERGIDRYVEIEWSLPRASTASTCAWPTRTRPPANPGSYSPAATRWRPHRTRRTSIAP